MSHLGRKRRATKQKGGSSRVVDGYAGIWVSADERSLDVLIRVKYARQCPSVRHQIELVGDIVRSESLEKEGSPGEVYTMEGAFPRMVRMKLPDKGVSLAVARTTFGRSNRDSTCIPVVIRGKAHFRAAGLSYL